MEEGEIEFAFVLPKFPFVSLATKAKGARAIVCLPASPLGSIFKAPILA